MLPGDANRASADGLLSRRDRDWRNGRELQPRIGKREVIIAPSAVAALPEFRQQARAIVNWIASIAGDYRLGGQNTGRSFYPADCHGLARIYVSMTPALQHIGQINFHSLFV